MEKSESIKNLAAALVQFQNEVRPVGKDGANPFFKSKYATLENVIETVRTPMVKHGLSFSQLPTDENSLTTILMHTSGEYISATVKMTPKDNTPQGQGSAITYMRRYSLSALLGLSTDEDDDGNAASREPYDLSPIPEAIRPTVHGADGEPKQPTLTPPKSVAIMRAQKKRQIKDLVDRLVLNPLDQTEEAYKSYILDNTALDLAPNNYDKIINILIKKQHGEEPGSDRTDNTSGTII